MFVLHVDLELKPGCREALEKTYAEAFRPAISNQEGFHAVALLRPCDAGNQYRLSIAFTSQALQKAWVATDLHQQVWPQVEQHCAGYSVLNFEVV